MTVFVQRRITPRSFFITLTAIVLSFSTPASHAGASPANCSIAQYELLSAYHEFFNTPKNNQLKQNIETRNIALSECIKTISAKLPPEVVTALNTSQKGMHSDLNYNIDTLVKTGDAERQPVASMVNYALETTKILDGQIDSKNATVGSLKKQAVLMAYIKSRYLERVYSLGGVGLIRESSTELSIEELVLDFSTKLDALRKDKSLIANKELYKKLNAVHVRFNFLKKSIMDYNKIAVPFLVGHHSPFIIETLLDISNELEQKSAKAA